MVVQSNFETDQKFVLNETFNSNKLTGDLLNLIVSRSIFNESSDESDVANARQSQSLVLPMTKFQKKSSLFN